jgi:rubrerythrin
MNLFFNAEEIFKIAIQIEQNGQAFYKHAAELFKGEIKQRLLGLAAMEETHEKFFTQLKASVCEPDIDTQLFDPDGDVERYLAALAGGYIFNVNESAEATLSGKKSIEDVLKLAIEREKESVVYYVGLKDVVPERLGKSKIDDIIKEEMKHVTLLSTTLANLNT